MSTSTVIPPRVGIIDYGMGNLFSVEQACLRVGLQPTISATPDELAACAGLILPGVGAFGDAMSHLEHLGLVRFLRDWVERDQPLFGICLGIQLLLSRSEEYGRHEGLNLIPGRVVHLRDYAGDPSLTVPHVGWNSVQRGDGTPGGPDPFPSLGEGKSFYFVHSYVVAPEDPASLLTWTEYGGARFGSSLRQGSIFACQFHPERSGLDGLAVYRDYSNFLQQTRMTDPYVKPTCPA